MNDEILKTKLVAAIVVFILTCACYIAAQTLEIVVSLAERIGG